MLNAPQDYEIAAFFLLVLAFEAWERLRPARSIDRLASLRTDVLSFLLAVLMNRLCTHSVQSFVEEVAPAFALDGLNAVRALPGWLKILLAIIAVDFMLYWIHRAQHRFEILWRTHAWHHSIEHLYWFSGFRTSFLHSFLYNIPQAAVPMLVFHLDPIQTGIAYSIGLFVQFWEHTNVRVGIGPLRYIVITPKYHRIHHSAVEPLGKNLAPIFSFWDLVFGTFVDPNTMPEEFPLGLGQPVEPRKMPRMVLGV
jgi:sterol desaturase/sphingolipid hydroxylase (fatty acid hydroxylase superfamily)